MSTIRVIYDLSNNTWSGEVNSLTSNYCDLQIGFTNNNIVPFEDLTFGYVLKDSNRNIQENNFPEDPTIKYKSCTGDYLVSDALSLEPNTKYSIKVWVKNNNKKSDFRYTIQTPDNTDTGHYENSSVPHPNNDRPDMYKFNTESRQWIKK